MPARGSGGRISGELCWLVRNSKDDRFLLGVEAKGLLVCGNAEGWCNGKVEGKSWGRGFRW